MSFTRTTVAAVVLATAAALAGCSSPAANSGGGGGAVAGSGGGAAAGAGRHRPAAVAAMPVAERRAERRLAGARLAAQPGSGAPAPVEGAEQAAAAARAVVARRRRPAPVARAEQAAFRPRTAAAPRRWEVRQVWQVPAVRRAPRRTRPALRSRRLARSCPSGFDYLRRGVERQRFERRLPRRAVPPRAPGTAKRLPSWARPHRTALPPWTASLFRPRTRATVASPSTTNRRPPPAGAQWNLSLVTDGAAGDQTGHRHPAHRNQRHPARRCRCRQRSRPSGQADRQHHILADPHAAGGGGGRPLPTTDATLNPAGAYNSAIPAPIGARAAAGKHAASSVDLYNVIAGAAGFQTSGRTVPDNTVGPMFDWPASPTSPATSCWSTPGTRPSRRRCAGRTPQAAGERRRENGVEKKARARRMASPSPAVRRSAARLPGSGPAAQDWPGPDHVFGTIPQQAHAHRHRPQQGVVRRQSSGPARFDQPAQHRRGFSGPQTLVGGAARQLPGRARGIRDP